MPKKFWQFRNSAKDGAELLLYGDIAERTWWGDEVTPKEFAEDLESIGNVDKITVRINSGGGDVFAATAIGNMLEHNSASVTAVIDGMCASSATIVACHCDKVMACADATYMIHPVSMGISEYYLDAETMRKYIEALETIRDNIVTLYAKKTGRDKETIGALMDATSWWTAEEAKEQGFVDELTEDSDKPAVENRNGILFINSVSMNMAFDKAPKFVQDSLAAAAPAAGRFENKNTPGRKPAANTKEEKEMEIKTVDELRKAYPDLYSQIEDAARNEATATERKRIEDIFEMRVSGCEELAVDAMFKNPVSADAFAKNALKNVKSQGEEYLKNLQKDTENSNMNKVTPTPDSGKGNEPDEFMNAIREQNKR